MVDMVIEILDARIPYSSTNPDLQRIMSDKYRLIVLNKSDFADPDKNREWIAWYKEKGINGISINSLNQADVNRVKKEVLDLSQEKRKLIKQKKGINKTMRIMVAGIPNVGKSTFINSFLGRRKAKTGDKPGVTKEKQWVGINPYLELLDTPGLLWPKLDDDETTLHLSYTGSIKEEVLNLEEIAHYFIEEIRLLCPSALQQRYGISDIEGRGYEVLERICIKRGWLRSGASPDTQRGAKQVLDEFKSGKLGRITLELP